MSFSSEEIQKCLRTLHKHVLTITNVYNHKELLYLLRYSDDMVLHHPSVSVLATCESYTVGHGLEYIRKKIQVMVIKTGKIKPH